MKKLLPLLLVLFWTTPAQALDLQKLNLKFHLGGYLGVQFFDKDVDLYSSKVLTEEEYGEYPGHMVLLGGRFGVSYKCFTVEGDLGFVPAILKQSDAFSPVLLFTLSGMYRFTSLIPKRYKITPFIKYDVGGMVIFANGDTVSQDGDFITGLGLGALYDLSDRFSLRLDANYFISDAVKNSIANNFQIKLAFQWNFEMDKDTDGDGIFDSKDKCKTTKEDRDGFQDGDGCPDPDNDQDGIPDTLDKCPGTTQDAPNKFLNTKEDRDGFQDGDGCPDPDNDQDGIPDTKDKCAGRDSDVDSAFLQTKEDRDGFQDGDGCPDPDNDGDGVPDTKDRCKGTDADRATHFQQTKEDRDGFEDDDGCPDPDNDRDGIPDTKDKCPGVQSDKTDGFKRTKEVINGYQDEDGCPDNKGKVKVILLEEKIKILDRVYFTFARATIRKRSYSLLNQIALTLKANPQITKLEIQGHTDTIGSASKNMTLSQKRAEAVRAYLVQRGVEDHRLVARGYGETRPLKKRCKRIRSRYRRKRCEKQNRRVEFIILEQQSR